MAMAYGDCAEVGWWLLSPHSRCEYPRTFEWGSQSQSQSQRPVQETVGGREVLRSLYCSTRCSMYCMYGWLMTRVPDSRRAGQPAIRLGWLRSVRHLILDNG